MIDQAAAADGGVVVRWLMIAAAVLTAAALVSGKLRDLTRDWREAGRERDDADIVELRRTVGNLTELLQDERADAQEWRALCSQLYAWILAAQHDPARLADPVPAPPPRVQAGG